MINYRTCDFCGGDITIMVHYHNVFKCQCGISNLYETYNGLNVSYRQKSLDFDLLNSNYFICAIDDYILVYHKNDVASRKNLLIKLDAKKFSLKDVFDNLNKYLNFI